MTPRHLLSKIVIVLTCLALPSLATAQLHPGGPPTDPSIPDTWTIQCPGTTTAEFDALDAMSETELQQRAAELSAAIAAAPSDLTLVVNAASVLMETASRLPSHQTEAIITEVDCDGVSILVSVMPTGGPMEEYVNANNQLFLDYVQRNYGQPDTEPNMVMCAVVTPLANAINLRAYDLVPSIIPTVVALVPPEWLRQSIEDLGEELYSVGPPGYLVDTMNASIDAGIDSVPIRNLLAIGLMCQNRLEDAVALLEQTSLLVPGDEIVTNNLSYFNRLLAEQEEVAGYQSTCDGGDLAACNELGAFYEDGYGVPQDLTRARLLYEQVCNGGNLRGCNNLAAMYLNGIGVAADQERAFHLFIMSCEGGSAFACGNVGVCYEYGAGVDVDMEQASEYYQMACDAGHQNFCDLVR